MTQTTRTAEEAAAACGCTVGQIVKSLVFRGARSGKPYLLLVSGANRVDEKGVAARIGEPLRAARRPVRARHDRLCHRRHPAARPRPRRSPPSWTRRCSPTTWCGRRPARPTRSFPIAPATLAEATGATIIRRRLSRAASGSALAQERPQDVGVVVGPGAQADIVEVAHVSLRSRSGSSASSHLANTATVEVDWRIAAVRLVVGDDEAVHAGSTLMVAPSTESRSR